MENKNYGYKITSSEGGYDEKGNYVLTEILTKIELE